MAVELPSELVEQILSWLPSKSLLRCRSVCKSWLSLISSPQFSLMHLHNFNQLNSRYLVRRGIQKEEQYAVHFDDQHFTLDTTYHIQFPSIFDLDGTRVLFLEIIGCCNGVICLSIDTIGTDEIILWNPSIRRKLNVIPPIYHENDLDIRYGFGYHKMSDDYKLVRLAYDPRESIPLHRVHIYSMKTTVWKAVVFPKDLPTFILYNCSQVFVNGSFHWIAFDWIVIRYSILTFDMSTELFGEIQFPKSLVHKGAMGVRLAVVGDSLALVYSSKPCLSSSTYKIWAMKEYNDPNSWTMIYKVCYPDKDVGRALGLTKNGDLITVGSTLGDVAICNQEGYYSLYGSCSKGIDSDYTFVERYQESLVLLGNDIQDTKELNDEV